MHSHQNVLTSTHSDQTVIIIELLILDSPKATGPDKIPVVVIKDLGLELSPILLILFNHCLKKKCPQAYGRYLQRVTCVQEYS